MAWWPVPQVPVAYMSRADLGKIQYRFKSNWLFQKTVRWKVSFYFHERHEIFTYLCVLSWFTGYVRPIVEYNSIIWSPSTGCQSNTEFIAPLTAAFKPAGRIYHSYTMLNSMGKSKNRYFYHIFVFWGRPWGNHAKCCMDWREFDAYKLSRCMCPSHYYRFWDRARYLWKKSSFYHTPCIRRSR